MDAKKSPKPKIKSELIKASRDSLWFIASETKRLNLSRALASGDKNKIIKASKEALSSIQCEKTKKKLLAVLQLVTTT